MRKVLIVDDEPSITTLLSFNLTKEGYAVETAEDGKTAMEMILQEDFDFIILDLMLPKMDGMDICRRTRQEKIDTPILMLTAKDNEIEKIIGLELGADDYMTKPFSPRELIARMKAIFRRSEKEIEEQKEDAFSENEKILVVGDLRIDPQRYEVRMQGNKVQLIPKEFELLRYMAKRQNRVLSRDKLLEAIWDFSYEGETRIVDVHISHLREKIECDAKSPRYIHTVRGFGYKLEVPEA